MAYFFGPPCSILSTGIFCSLYVSYSTCVVTIHVDASLHQFVRRHYAEISTIHCSSKAPSPITDRIAATYLYAMLVIFVHRKDAEWCHCWCRIWVNEAPADDVTTEPSSAAVDLGLWPSALAGTLLTSSQCRPMWRHLRAAWPWTAVDDLDTNRVKVTGRLSQRWTACGCETRTVFENTSETCRLYVQHILISGRNKNIPISKTCLYTL